MEFVLYLMLIR